MIKLPRSEMLFDWPRLLVFLIQPVPGQIVAHDSHVSDVES